VIRGRRRVPHVVVLPKDATLVIELNGVSAEEAESIARAYASERNLVIICDATVKRQQ
jgi:hypothetical protein